MSSITLSQARALLDGALQAGRMHNLRPLAVAIVDCAGHIVASAREDNAPPLRLTIASGKANAAIGMSINTRALSKKASEMPIFFTAIASSSQQPFIPQTGAMLVLDGLGNVLGAAGASGGTGDEDEMIIIAGIRAAGLQPA